MGFQRRYQERTSFSTIKERKRYLPHSMQSTINDLPVEIIAIIASNDIDVARVLSILNKYTNSAVTNDVWHLLLHNIFFSEEYNPESNYRERVLYLRFHLAKDLFNVDRSDEIRALIVKGHNINEVRDFEIPIGLLPRLFRGMPICKAIYECKPELVATFIQHGSVSDTLPMRQCGSVADTLPMRQYHHGGMISSPLSFLPCFVGEEIGDPVQDIRQIETMKLLLPLIKDPFNGSEWIYCLHEVYKNNNDLETLKKMFNGRALPDHIVSNKYSEARESDIGNEIYLIMEDAVRRGDEETLKYLLSIGLPMIDDNDWDYGDPSPNNYSVEMLELLLKYGYQLADQNQLQNNFLLTGPKDIKQLFIYSTRALQCCSMNNDIAVIEFLLQQFRKDSIWFKIIISRTVMFWEGATLTTIKHLLSLGLTIPKKVSTLSLQLLVRNNNIEVVRFLIEGGLTFTDNMLLIAKGKEMHNYLISIGLDSSLRIPKNIR